MKNILVFEVYNTVPPHTHVLPAKLNKDGKAYSRGSITVIPFLLFNWTSLDPYDVNLIDGWLPDKTPSKYQSFLPWYWLMNSTSMNLWPEGKRHIQVISVSIPLGLIPHTVYMWVVFSILAMSEDWCDNIYKRCNYYYYFFGIIIPLRGCCLSKHFIHGYNILFFKPNQPQT